MIGTTVNSKPNEILDTGKKELLSFFKCTVAKDKISVETDAFFEVQMNPTKFYKDHNIEYKHNRALGHLGSESKFVGVSAERINFEFTVDSTGIIGESAIEINTLLPKLEKGLYEYDGDNHEPNRVQVVWGELIFTGRLENMNYEHVLFRPNGLPLRTNIKMNFVQCLTTKEIANRKNTSSPDLSHIVEVRAGDTLPNLCHKIYRDCRYYSKIARINNLSHSTDIYPGMQLNFPPLEN